MKVAFFGAKNYDREGFQEIEKGYDAELLFIEARLGLQTTSLAAGCQGVCAFVNDDLSEPVLKELAMVGIEVIFLRCAGYNQVDLKAAWELGLRVLRVPSYSPEAVAEFATGLLLTVDRKYHKAYLRTRDFNMSIVGLMGRNLHGMTAGIIGTGKIGKAMIRILQGFGMKILAYDAFPDKKLAVEYVSLEELYRNSDVISLHCPLTQETRDMIDRSALKIMKPGVYLINTSRGMLIRTEDLIEALLIPGKIGGVGLDVYEEEDGVFYEDNSEKIMQDKTLARLITFPNVVVTSHQGYFTKEAMKAIAITTMENIKMYENGEVLINEVKYEE